MTILIMIGKSILSTTSNSDVYEDPSP